MSTDALSIARPIIAAAAAANVPPPALLLTADDLARELRLSVKTIRRQDAAGRLPRHVKVGHAVRWPRETIEAWIAAGCPAREEWEAFHAPRPRKT